jgi:plasmid maintenance system antidote protein VapI
MTLCEQIGRSVLTSADTAIRLGKYFGLPAQFWLNLQNDYDLRLAEARGIGKRIKPRAVDHEIELTSFAN